MAKLLRDNIEDLFMVRIYRSRQKQCVYERGHLSKVAKGKPVAYPGFTATKKMFCYKGWIVISRVMACIIKCAELSARLMK